MGLPKSKNAVGLGNSLMNDRFGKGKGHDMRRTAQGIPRTGPDGQTYITTPKEQAQWMKMRSVTEQNDLDEFLSTAELAGTDFTAEKMNNIKIIHRDQKNPYLLSAAEERMTARKQNANRKRLTVPRRPPWDESTTATELDAREREALMHWRRGIAEMQENNDLLLTPFERNLEVWRQLWRVIERSDLVVQIVDARNPLLFRCEDLEHYVKEVDSRKNNLLLINKADMMSVQQRQIWANYFEKSNINFRFFSARLSSDSNGVDSEDSSSEAEDDGTSSSHTGDDDIAEATSSVGLPDEPEEEDEWSSEDDSVELEATQSDLNSLESTRILSTDELEALFIAHAPKSEAVGQEGQLRKTQIGLVGYPNVGKSSTINALIGAKKVSVSATPGKTKHFQTIHLSDEVILCDCPGLVFPNFANTKAELVCNGILPIDQMREYTGPAALVAQRIPQSFMEAIYGIRIQTRPAEEGGSGVPTGEEVLVAYAAARGFWTQGQGQPDQSRSARYVLKDYVKGKLLYCHPPPAEPPIDGHSFNRELYDIPNGPQKRRAHAAAHELSSGGKEPSLENHFDAQPPKGGRKTTALDKRFFAPGQGNAGHLYKSFEFDGRSSGRELTGRKLKQISALERDIDPADLKAANYKKHYKGNKKTNKKAKSEVL